MINLNLVTKVLNTLLATKMIMSLCIILSQMRFYIFENGGKICHVRLKMIGYYLNIMKLGTKLKIH